jgi:hypothetical protein
VFYSSESLKRSLEKIPKDAAFEILLGNFDFTYCFVFEAVRGVFKNKGI